MLDDSYSDIAIESSADVSALEERLIRMEGLLFDLQNQNQQCVDSLATLAVKPSMTNVAEDAQHPAENNKANQAHENYLAHKAGELRPELDSE